MQLINQLNEAHAQLLALAEEKKQVLIANDMRRLSEIVKEEPRHIKRIEGLEQERLSLMGSVTMTEWIKTHPRCRLAPNVVADDRSIATAQYTKRGVTRTIPALFGLASPTLDSEADDFTYGQSALNQTHFNRNA
ncbi:flagellar protein FlgN [Exiguobacterium sp. SL14]|nr:flagellar protein FlgN [Exiguobacterium sp. SL14]MCY1690117.1 flagellar protein FlgN [Exiguobacterium sp. SL14]